MSFQLVLLKAVLQKKVVTLTSVAVSLSAVWVVALSRIVDLFCDAGMMSSSSSLQSRSGSLVTVNGWQLLQPLLFCIALSLVMLAAPGCSTPKPVDEKEPAKDRITADPVKVLPIASNGVLSNSRPGSFIQTRQRVSANNSDEELVLDYSQKRSSEHGFVFNDIVFSRSTSIAKKESKNIEGSLFLFGYVGDNSKSEFSFESTQLTTEIVDKNLGTTIGVLSERVRLMQDYQSSLIILADNIDTQSFWSRTSVVAWPFEAGASIGARPFLCVPINSRDLPNNFPTSFYGLSTSSTIYWDDIAASDLNDQQKEAILDWLNFGGRLIINGPQTIASLSNSFLSPYLPLNNLVPRTDDVDSVAKTLDRFTLEPAASTIQEDILRENVDEAQKKSDEVQAKLTVKISNVDASVISAGLCRANLSSSGKWVPECEGLLAESQVGNGRICMSTFDLTGDKIINWTSYGNFLHSAAFRLPGRSWTPIGGSYAYVFEGNMNGKEKSLATYSSVRTPVLSTHANTERTARNSVAQDNENWSEDRFNRLALNNIQTTSGIKVPPINALTQMIGVYLLVLVPANWCVFRILNRLEWAWFSIPLIAVSSAAIFAYSLQIQIGFARSQNSIGWLQLEEGYDRASLSRQISIYTSLSSRFRLSLPSDQGFVLPIQRQMIGNQSSSNVEYSLNDEYGSGIRNHPIRSHTSVLFQSDELVNVGGPIQISGKDNNLSIQNNSNLQLQDVIWIRKRDNQKTLHWVGPFSPETTLKLDEAKAYSKDEIFEKLRQSIPVADTSSSPQQENVDDGLRNMIYGYLESNDGNVDSDNLVGWTKNMVSRLTVFPEPAQKNEVTLVSLNCAWKLEEKVEKDNLLPLRNIPAELPIIPIE